ncbi:kelch-like protein 7 isoform X2 [Kryptolebias marmoratus]|uniref:kelch-like protein 7 isoform X2 n=1 Tax=Kryptolebias marmoratus TaxID=37003 RepID=UPI000D5301AB|nr:kelch-like protein 7 isoform X2 [Kryptolebias marmoratus]
MEMASKEKTGRIVSDQWSDIGKVVNAFRMEGVLCDVTLVVQGRLFPVHRLVLAAASHFFRLMFTTNMQESVSQAVELHEVEPEIMEQLIGFLYTERISVNETNVQSLLLAADRYHIYPVKTTCLEFLEERTDASNCLGISALADLLDCPRLKAKAERFALRHFTKVVQFEEFPRLDVTRLVKLLQHDDLTDCTEEEVYDAASLWLRHDLPGRQQHLEEVLSCVRFPLISQTFLLRTVQPEPMIQDNPKCLSMLLSAMGYHLLPRKDRKGLSVKTRSRRNQIQRIALFKSSAPHICRYFNPKDYNWTNFSCSFEERREAAAVYCDDLVCVLGGWNRRGFVKRIDCYSVRQRIWFCKWELPRARTNMAACASQGKIYVSGGSYERWGSALSLFECFDTETESWEAEPSMSVSRSGHGSVAANGLVYVCGGSNGISRRIVSSCEVYNPATRQWTTLCSMRQARKDHGLVAVQNRIYAVGGFLKSVEYYDIATNEWRAAASMPCSLLVKCAAVGDVIYVLAGESHDADLQQVMEYHIDSNSWVTSFKVSPFPFKDSVICVVDSS